MRIELISGGWAKVIHRVDRVKWYPSRAEIRFVDRRSYLELAHLKQVTGDDVHGWKVVQLPKPIDRKQSFPKMGDEFTHFYFYDETDDEIDILREREKERSTS